MNRPSYRAKGDSCPSCRKTPPIRFSIEQVERCKRDRAAGHHTEVHCGRCGRRYWIQNWQIAEATPERPPRRTSGRPQAAKNGKPKVREVRKNGNRLLPDSFPVVAAIREYGIYTVGRLNEVEDLTEIPGVGPSRSKEIEKALAELGS